MANAKVKTWRLTPESQAYFQVKEEEVFMGSGTGNFIAVDASGITTRGNISFGAMGEGQRTGGFFINMNEMIKMVPTTMVTPIPPILPIPPLGFIKTIKSAVTAMTALTSVA